MIAQERQSCYPGNYPWDADYLKGNKTSVNYFALSQNWEFKKRTPTCSIDEDFTGPGEWLPASVPGTVHQDLLAAERIPDPFLEMNEALVQWIGESDWLYRCAFDASADGEGTAVLCFDGLDTFATVWLNGTQILVSDNMFVPQRVPVKTLLRPGQNELRILFESALRRGKEREAHYGKLELWNGDSSRAYVRKAQYHYGWDWGPVLLTAGPWREIRLETYTARIVDVHCPVEMAVDLQTATLPVQVQLEGDITASLALDLSVHAPGGEVVAQHTVPVSSHSAQHTFHLASPQLWWPRGYGEQPLYRIEATLRQETEELERRDLHLGLRRLQLIQRAVIDAPGTSFFFEINNTPIFCGGANWIPADSFTPRITTNRYRHWLQLAAEGNMTMLRVWGGGIYEEDSFYSLCDEFGLLVWQDFLFACGIYPALEWFQQSVKAEVEANVRRLRHHPSIVLWCGNNEDYAIAESQGYQASESVPDANSRFPARVIYEQILPEMCQQLDPTRPYWPGSPYGGKSSADTTVGDVHVWSVWHGLVPYQKYPGLAGRFVSEFGMEALPDLATIEAFTQPAERYPQSRTLDWHNKATGGPRNIMAYLVENIRVPSDLESYIYATQFNQSEALGAAVRGWRRGWGGPGREYVSGVLVWQLDDCWPVTSWAIADYELRLKPAYYTLRREFAPFALGLSRLSQEQAEVWAANSLLDATTAQLELRTWSLSGELVAEERRQVVLKPNQATELGQVASRRDDSLVLSARLLKDGIVIARAALWPEPFKYLTLPDPHISIERVDATTLRVHAQRPAKGVWLAAGDMVHWSDNMLDLFPNDPQSIVVYGLDESAIQVKSLYT